MIQFLSDLNVLSLSKSSQLYLNLLQKKHTIINNNCNRKQMINTVSRLNLLILLVVCASSQQGLLNNCGANQIQTPSGCFLACTDSSFKDCPDVFIALYNPSFCAYKTDGTYFNYTFSCQACQNSDVIAVRAGPCSCSNIRCYKDEYCQDGQCLKIDKCAAVSCLVGSSCINGTCVASTKICTSSDQCNSGYFCLNGKCLDKCAYIRCTSGHICFQGQCLKQCSNNSQCDSGNYCNNGTCVKSELKNCTDPNPIKCTLPRPTQKTCPTLTWIRKPDNLVCGVMADGTLVDFPVECYACKQSNIIFYYNQTCDSIPPKQIYCKQPRPTETACPTLYFFVKPADLVCGLTKAGDLINFPVQCYACKQKDIVLYYNKTCEQVQKLNCSLPPVDQCALIRCKQGYKCVNGSCILINNGCAQQKKLPCCQPRPNELTCPTQYFIVKPKNLVCGVTYGGKLLDFAVQCYACKQQNIAYYYNQTCDSLSQLQNCSVNQDLCSLIKCKAEYQCISGNCVQVIIPCTLLCIKGYHCQNQKCVPDVIVDSCANVACISTQTCINGTCVDIIVKPCKLFCIKGYHCENQKCVPDVVVIYQCANILCVFPQTCLNGTCVYQTVNPCTLLCIQGYHCVNGTCVPL